MKIRKAIFPVAGLGTRFLPATKASPKELLPIVDKPLIQYAVEEAIDAGIEELIFVTSSNKRAIEDHFDRNIELETYLEERGQHGRLALVRDMLPPGVSCAYVRQSEPKGLGDAILCAKRLVGDEPFAVLLADDLIDGMGTGALKQMMAFYEEEGGQVLAASRVPKHDVDKYGIAAGVAHGTHTHLIKQLVEKPSPEETTSDLAVIGRYILHPSIFDALERAQPGKNGEIQLTDAIAALLLQVPTYAYRFQGIRYDCGSKLGYMQASLAYALKDPAIAEALKQSLSEVDLL
ncbi:MAG: UTP--glucose-1-phosphate uridylyltransferase GalU [Gammaproteobacteria bacterium]